ncbi:unnamed protein product [Trichobilharzia szidati]|nr:unnamed protein product [Trichobilharzia szidati]
MKRREVVLTFVITVTILWYLSYIIRRNPLRSEQIDSTVPIMNIESFLSKLPSLPVYSNHSIKTKWSYVSSEMGKHENKLTVGFDEKYLEKLYDNQRKGKSVVKKKIIMHYGEYPILTISNYTSCYACECELSYNRSRWREADIIILTDENYPRGERPRNQLWFIFIHEPPHKVKLSYDLGDRVNYTITYRQDSSVFLPYHNYKPFDPSHSWDTRYPLPSRNYAIGKTKMAAWFVTNCNPNSPRNEYAEELSKHFESQYSPHRYGCID